MTSSRSPRCRLAALALVLAAVAACQPGTSPHPVSPSAGFTVSGSVTGTVSSGATVRLAGRGGVRFAVTDGAGRFEFAALERGQYDLMPVGGAGVAFAPSTRRITVVDGDVGGQDFTSGAASVLQGTVQGVGAGEAVVTIEGPVTVERATDARGAYRAEGLPEGTYLVRAAPAPLAPLRYFSPIGAEITLSGGAVVTQHFSSGPAGALHAIAGTVSGAAVGGVVLRLEGPGLVGLARSGADGHYSFAGVPDGSYRVVASPPAGVLFRQRDRDVTLAAADVVGVDFECYAPPRPRFAYLAAWNDPTEFKDVLLQFAVGADGALSPLAPAAVSLPGRAQSLVASPSGGQVYAGLVGAASLAQFAVGQDGQLLPLDPATVPGDANPSLLAVDPAGAWLWAYSPTTLRISLYAIGAGGVLEPRPQLADVGESVTGMVVHPSGRSLYAASASGLRQFAVGADGTLTPLAPALVPAATDLLLTGSTHLTFTTIQYDAIALDPTGRYAYATQLQFSALKSAVAAFLVMPDGTLTSLGWGARAELSDVWLRDGPTALSVEPGGRAVYAGYWGHLLFPAPGPSQYRLELNGVISDVNPVSLAAGGPNQAALVASPTGQHLYAVNNTASTAGVTWLSIGPDGLLTPQGSVQAGYSAAALVLAGQ